MKTLIPIGLLILVGTATATAQKKLPTKPYTEWNLNEVTRILNDSQWIQRNIYITPTRYRSDSPDHPAGTDFFVELRLYSALPVRQAIVRRMQLTIPYDKLTGAQRANFDAEIDGLLKCPQCAEYYIVTLTSTTKDPLNLVSRGAAVTLDTVAVLKREPQDELPRHVSLSNDKGDRRTATRAVFTRKNEIVFLFRRLDDQGNPLISVNNKKFYVEFDEYLLKKSEGALKKFTFNVGDLVGNGEVVF